MKPKTKQSIFGIALVSPFLAGSVFFYFLPFLVSLYYSLTKDFRNKTVVGLDNYVQLFHNEAFLLAIKNTAIFMGIAIPLLILSALLAGMLVHGLGKAGYLLQTAFILPMIVPIASVTKVWQILFEDQGVVNHMLAGLGMERQQFLRSGWAMAVVILIFVWKNFGYLSIIYAVALSAIPGECVEAAKMDGGGRIRIFTKIIVPFLRPTTFFVLLLAIINSFKIFREVYMLTGEYPDTSIYFIQHFMNNNFYNLDYQKLSAASAVLTLCIVIIVAVIFKKEKKSAYME